MSGKRFSGDKSKRNGFYIALAVCLVAIGVAAWSTYEAVNSFVEAPDVETQETTNDVVSRTVPESTQNSEDGEAINKQKETASKATAQESSAEETNASVAETTTPEETEPSGFISQSQEYDHPVNAGVIYEISEVMAYPVASSEIISMYSKGVPVYSETMKDWRIHNGIDIAAESGSTVKACANGQVKEILADSMLGNVLVIEHGDYLIRYCGLNEEMLVGEGDILSAGQEIGTVGAIPCEAAIGSHIHLEITKDEIYMNPVDIFEEFGS